MDRPRKVTYRSGLLDPSNLASPSKIEQALLELGAVINRANYVEVLKDLLDKKYVLVLVLSGMHEDIPLKEWILDDFPSNPSHSENSFARALLQALCDFFQLYSASADAETNLYLRRHHHYVLHGSEVLKILLNISFVEEENSEKSPPPSPTKKRAKVSQREQRQARKLARASSSIDHKPFTALNLPVPKNRDEADSLCETVWLKMGSILDVLLSGTRRPEVIDAIHALLVPQERPEELVIPAHFAAMVDAPIPSPSSPHATEEAPPEYSMVQSMKVTFYFEPPVDFGKWRILLASQAQCDLRHWQRRDQKIFLIIMKKLNELSHGFFSNDNQKRLCGPSTDVPVFEAKMTGDLRLVYTVDCITDSDNQSEVQALRVFGIFTHSQMDYRLWECVGRFISSRSKEYRKRCQARRVHPDGGNIYLPQSFPEPVQLEEPSEFNLTLPANDVNQLHHIITLEKYVMLSKDLLESIESNKEANFPFEVSKPERAIIEYPNSCYVLGRSGTGKTTTMLFKMLLIERAYQLSEVRLRPRQMFVTKSRALADKVEELFMTYLSSFSHWDELNARRSMNTSYDDIFNEDEDDTEWRGDLPGKFSELEDIHFPLFITFHSLCTMIEADMKAAQSAESIDSHKDNVMELFGNARSATRKGKLVTFDRFIAEYWPKLEQSRFHALLIFNEIMGVIAGSEWSILSPNGYLDREAYINLSPRMYPVFAEHRETMYGMFVSYLKRKRELDDYDLADRTHTIIRYTAKKPFPLQKVSHLYVDEAQDNLLIDIFLLRLLCGNSDGLFWAGDTAQTISAGSSFRFNDLKAFLYRLQKGRPDRESSLTPMRVKEPGMFYLSANYRSHAGIVNCAHSIVEIINKYWQNSIDQLPRERGNAHGATPIFYTHMYPEFVREGHFVSRDRSRHGKIELGADQCILVRDKKTREKLRKEVGDENFGKLGIVLTLYQSKGLEFNDVLLYNFFHDSLVGNAWRLVLNDVSHDQIGQSRIAAPQFDPTRHATLCSELKGLYVAITRARNNLRIVDESLIGEPMRALWESHGQILSCKPGQESTDFAQPSNQETWANRAKRFFDNCEWELAKQSYEKAGKKQAASVADAYLQREKARRIPSEGRGKMRNLSFKSAAKAFESCAENTADVLAKNKYLKLSAACWEEGNDTCRAAEVYREGNWLSDASRLYRKLGKFDEIYDIITKSDADLQATIPEAIRDATRLHFISKNCYRKVHELFRSVEEEHDYLEDRSLHDAQLDLFVHHGRKREAADLYLSEGRTPEALDLYLQYTDEHDSMSKAKEIILNGLWQLSPFGVTPDARKMNELLDRAEKLIPGVMDDNDIEEMMMFRAIPGGSETKLCELANSFLKRGNQHAALLCYDHYFEHLPALTDEDIERVAFKLRQFSDYVHSLRAFLDDRTASDPRACKLFGFRTGEEKGTIVLLKPNTLHDSSFLIVKDLPMGDLELTQVEFLSALRKCLESRLKDRVTQENDICGRSLHRPICLPHIVYKNCRSTPCDRSHISPDPVWFHHWVNAHLLQIVIYQTISGIQYPRQFRSQQRFWLVKLYEALNPASHEFGSTSNMNTALNAFPLKSVNVLIEWIRAVSFDLEFEQENFLTFVIQTADFAFAYDKKEAEVYMNRCKFVTDSCPPEFCRKPNVNCLQEMLMSWNQKGSSNLLMGIFFISHVLERKIPVNIHVFCTFIERICSLLIVSNRLRRKGNLHGIMLPRTWLKATLDNIDVEEAKLQDSFCFFLLLQPLEKLLHTLYFPPAHGKFQFKFGTNFRAVENQGPAIRRLFIARICRVLGILGTNISVNQFRDQIVDIFTSIRQEVSHYELDPRLYNRYFEATTFYEVHVATRQSMRTTIFDGMVRISCSERLASRPRHRITGLQDIVYSTQEELASQLGAMEHATPLHSSVALSHIEHDGASLEFVEHDVKDLDVDSEIDEEAPEGLDLMEDTEIPEGIYIGHSKQERDAAKLIELYWLKFLYRKREMLKAGQEYSARRWFADHKKALLPAMSMRPDPDPDRKRDPRPPRYSVYVLGPLPNLHAALDSIQPILHQAKGFIKNNLGNNHEDLEEDGLKLTRINKAMKNLKRQQYHLRPDSVLHTKCNIEELKKQVQDVFNIVDDIRPLVELPDDMQETLKMIYKAVLQEHKPKISLPPVPVKERRPQLVMEDLQDLIMDVHEGI